MPDGVQGWDRYAYVNNNPLKYNDPSGNYLCNDGYEGCNDRKTTFQFTTSDYINQIEGKYGMIIYKDYRRENYSNTPFAEWSLNQAKIIYNALQTMAAGLNRITGGDGIGWINRNLGGTVFGFDIIAEIGGGAFVINNGIHLHFNFDKSYWNSIDGTVVSMLIHELGHVFDNRLGWAGSDIFGGGGGDALMYHIGMNPMYGLRCFGGIVFYDTTLAWPITESGLKYGNNSTADYFAHTFSSVILAPGTGPSAAENWMATIIDLT